MVVSRPFEKDDVLFRQRDASDRVWRIRSGEIEILREVGAASVLLGRVCEGEWLGEMGVIESRARSATARAATDGVAEELTVGEFLDHVTGDPALARELILRLSIRLRKVEDQIAGNLLPVAPPRRATAPDGTTMESVAGEGVTLSLAARSDALRARIGAAPIPVAALPFVVGRPPLADEAEPWRAPDLLIEDDEPLRLSRDHFAIMHSGGRLVVADLGSTLGTSVNGQALGHQFARDAAPLHRGENRVVAGGADSPFDFTLTVS